MEIHKTWHEKYHEKLSFGDLVADMVAKGMGSWKFIIFQTVLTRKIHHKAMKNGCKVLSLR